MQIIAKKALFIEDLLGDIAIKKEAANALKPTGLNKTDIKLERPVYIANGKVTPNVDPIEDNMVEAEVYRPNPESLAAPNNEAVNMLGLIDLSLDSALQNSTILATSSDFIDLKTSEEIF